MSNTIVTIPPGGVHPTASRRALPGVAALLVGLLSSGPAHPDAAPGDACPGLAAYNAKSYATDKGRQRRCALLRDIERHGNLASHPLRERLLTELANRFAVEMDFEGEVDLPAPVVDYLLENMPEAAAMVSTYMDKDYGATQADSTPGPRGFFVTNSKTFAASFTYLYSRSSGNRREHMFFESGHARVLLWRIWGNSFVHYALERSDPQTSRYDITVHVFTDSRLLRTILSSDLFGYFADRMFKGILDDIESAVERFEADGAPGQRLPPYFVAGLDDRLEQPGEPVTAR